MVFFTLFVLLFLLVIWFVLGWLLIGFPLYFDAFMCYYFDCFDYLVCFSLFGFGVLYLMSVWLGFSDFG